MPRPNKRVEKVIRVEKRRLGAMGRLLYGLAVMISLLALSGTGGGYTSLLFPLTVRVVPLADFWYEGFLTGVSSPDLRNWTQGPNASIWLAGTLPPSGVVALAAAGQGSVSSPLLTADVSKFGMLGVKVDQVDPGLSWKLRVQDANQPAVFWESPWIAQTGTYTFYYAALSGWSGVRNFRIQWILQGGAGQSLHAGYLKLTGFARQDPDAGFLRRRPELSADQLFLGDTVVKIKGVNYYPANHGWLQMWTEWEPGQIDAELARCAALGVNTVRAFIQYGVFGEDVVRLTMLARLEEFLGLAEKHGLKVVLSLFDLALEKVAPSLVPPATTSPRASATDLAKMDQHMQAVVSRFKDDARILGWGVTNELDLHTTQRCTALVESDADAWHNHMAGLIKSVDSRHLVIAASARAETVNRYDLASVDVFTLHTGSTLDREAAILDRARAAMAAQGQIRPILFEEFGQSYPLAPTPSPDPVLATEFYSRVWGDIFSRDAAGGLVWLLNDTEWRDTPSSPATPHTYGLYTAAGAPRIQPAVFQSAYQGTAWSAPAPVPRPAATPTPAAPADALEHVLLTSQEQNFPAKWYNVSSGVTLANGSVLIQITPQAGAQFYYGSIQQKVVATPPNSFIMNLDQAADIRIAIPTATPVAGQWYAFLHHWPEGATQPDFSVRIQQDTTKTGAFWYHVKDYLPGSLAAGAHRFMLEIGASNTWRWGSTTRTLVTEAMAYNGRAGDSVFAWRDHFDGGTPGTEPPGWQDENQDSSFNAYITYAPQTSQALVTRTNDAAGWGKVLSPLFTSANVLAHPYVEIKVAQVASNTVWKVGIQEVDSPWQNKILNGSSNQIGTFRFRYPETMGWTTGTHRFRVQVIVEAGPDKNIALDYAGILGMATPSPTPSFTATPLPTATFTPTANI